MFFISVSVFYSKGFTLSFILAPGGVYPLYIYRLSISTQLLLTRGRRTPPSPHTLAQTRITPPKPHCAAWMTTISFSLMRVWVYQNRDFIIKLCHTLYILWTWFLCLCSTQLKKYIWMWVRKAIVIEYRVFAPWKTIKMTLCQSRITESGGEFPRKRNNTPRLTESNETNAEKRPSTQKLALTMRVWRRKYEVCVLDFMYQRCCFSQFVMNLHWKSTSPQ